MKRLTEQKKSSSNKKRKRRPLNIGIIIFGIIFIYLIATIVMYLMKPNVTPYEVREGSLVKDYSYTGLAIRDEIPVFSDTAGYVNYYLTDNSRVKVGSTIYTLSNTQIDFGNTVSETVEKKLSTKEKKEISLQIQDFCHDFTESTFSNLYSLKNSIADKLNQKTNQNRLDILDEMIRQNEISGIAAHQAAKDGVIAYYIDGMEGISIETVTLEQLNHTNYKKTELSNNMSIKAGDPVYKLITNDEWYVLIEITEETAKALDKKSSIDVTFNKDGKTLNAEFEIKELNGVSVLYLKFADSMIRYINERYLDVDLVIENQSGLKIPKTATVDLELFIIPKRYLTKGGDSSGPSLIVNKLNKDGSYTEDRIEPTIYFSTDEVIYLSKNEFNEGDQIIQTESKEVHIVREKRLLKGVFCINKGYAVFKPIVILSESDDYYIIENGNSYSVTNYDHIALHSSNIKENDIVF